MSDTEQTLFPCSGCGHPQPRGHFHEAHYTDRGRPVTSRCRSCRREDYFSKRYTTICQQCSKHRPLDSNLLCRACNADNGVRQCRGICQEILPVLLGFERSRTVCKQCRAVKRESASLARQVSAPGSPSELSL